MTINLRTGQGWSDLKRVLDDRPSDVLALCRLDLDVPTGSTSRTIVTDDPRGQGHDNFALWFKADGLSWKNYTTGECGRSLELIAYCNGWYHLDRRGAMEAARFACDRLRLSRIDQKQLEQDRDRAAAQRAQAEKDAEADQARKRAAAFNLFRNALPILGTAAETYWREARTIDLRAAPFVGPRGGSLVPNCLRFVPRHKYVHRDRRGAKIGESFHPCQIACCVDGNMRIVAVHQTYLAPDGRGKAVIPPAPDGTKQAARKVFPESLGCVIPLWRGDGHLSISEANDAGLLQTFGFSEGTEDGLTGVLAHPDWRWWAMISLSNMTAVAQRLPACCDAVLIHRQSDWEKPGAVAQFDRGLAAFRATGRPVADFAAFGGKDINDTLRGEGL
ncbi:hypothetical protein LOC51_19965 [Rubrivivax sp. JA1024]|nr:hypothetical protein [Rubrivivax sp. JA1024]